MDEKRSSYGRQKELEQEQDLMVAESQGVRTHRDLRVFQAAFNLAMSLFELSKAFPKEETYSLTDQVRRSSRSVATNLSEAWQKRRYPAAFVSKLNDSEAEVSETQTWIEFAVACKYLDGAQGCELLTSYENVLRTLSAMIKHSEHWTKPIKNN